MCWMHSSVDDSVWIFFKYHLRICNSNSCIAEIISNTPELESHTRDLLPPMEVLREYFDSSYIQIYL